MISMSVLKWKERQKEGEQLRIITKIQMIEMVTVNIVRRVCIC